MLIKAPWTPEQVAALNKYQQECRMHPFTCGNPMKSRAEHEGEGVLLATESGWKCEHCDYAQDWCHDWMIDIGQIGLKEWKLGNRGGENAWLP